MNYCLTWLLPLKAPEEDESNAENWELLLGGVSFDAGVVLTELGGTATEKRRRGSDTDCGSIMFNSWSSLINPQMKLIGAGGIYLTEGFTHVSNTVLCAEQAASHNWFNVFVFLFFNLIWKDKVYCFYQKLGCTQTLQWVSANWCCGLRLSKKSLVTFNR